MASNLPPRAMRPRAFIDANIIANWMLLDQAVRALKPKSEQALKELREKTGRKFPSYLLLEELRALGTHCPISFGTSTFAIAETSHAILEEYLSRRLYERGVPFRYWESLRKQEYLSKQDVAEVEDWIHNFVRIFFHVKRRVLYWYERPDFAEVVFDTISLHVSSTDAFLLSQAVHVECEYYVTEDKTLRNTIRDARPITPIAAQDMLSKLKHGA